eukprot:scaffold17513_cov220-Cylindrotheca_fusiformis.AAC.1
MEEVVEDADDECIEKCTINGELDAGCVIDCEVLGGEAGDEYVEKEEETPTVNIPPTNPPAPTSIGACSLPEGTEDFSIITKGDAAIAAHS